MIMFNTIRRPSATTLRVLFTSLSLVAMALAGGAGSHWS
jgi:hypothetical protein